MSGVWPSPSVLSSSMPSASTTHGPTPGAGRQARPSSPLRSSRFTKSSSGTSTSTTCSPARSPGSGIGTAIAAEATHKVLNEMMQCTIGSSSPVWRTHRSPVWQQTPTSQGQKPTRQRDRTSTGLLRSQRAHRVPRSQYLWWLAQRRLQCCRQLGSMRGDLKDVLLKP